MPRLGRSSNWQGQQKSQLQLPNSIPSIAQSIIASLPRDVLAGRMRRPTSGHRRSGSEIILDRIEAGQRVAATVRLALEVPDSAATADRLVAARAEAVAEPVTTPWGDRNARVRAPDGMQLTLFTPPSA